MKPKVVTVGNLHACAVKTGLTRFESTGGASEAWNNPKLPSHSSCDSQCGQRVVQVVGMGSGSVQGQRLV